MRLRSWHVNVTFSGVGHALSHAFMLFYATVVLVLEQQWRLSYGELFALSIPGAIAFALTSLPAGWLADRWGVFALMAVLAVIAVVAVCRLPAPTPAPVRQAKATLAGGAAE